MIILKMMKIKELKHNIIQKEKGMILIINIELI